MQGVYSDRIELQNIKARFPLPDFSAAYKYSKGWGYVRAAGILRRIKWDDTLARSVRPVGQTPPAGDSTSARTSRPAKTPRSALQFVFGEGIENYMNDSPVDIGIENNLSNPVTPILGKPIPIVGIVAFLDHTWNEKFTSAFGYSSAGQRQHRRAGAERVP